MNKKEIKKENTTADIAVPDMATVQTQKQQSILSNKQKELKKNKAEEHIIEDKGYDFAAAEREYRDREDYNAAIKEEIKVLYDTLKGNSADIAKEIADIMDISVDKVEKVIADFKDQTLKKEDKKEDIVDGYVFGYKGDVLVIKGLEHPTAEKLAINILAKFRKIFQTAIEEAGLGDLIITIEQKEKKKEEK